MRVRGRRLSRGWESHRNLRTVRTSRRKVDVTRDRQPASASGEGPPFLFTTPCRTMLRLLPRPGWPRGADRPHSPGAVPALGGAFSDDQARILGRVTVARTVRGVAGFVGDCVPSASSGPPLRHSAWPADRERRILSCSELTIGRLWWQPFPVPAGTCGPAVRVTPAPGVLFRRLYSPRPRDELPLAAGCYGQSLTSRATEPRCGPLALAQLRVARELDELRGFGRRPRCPSPRARG